MSNEHTLISSTDKLYIKIVHSKMFAYTVGDIYSSVSVCCCKNDLVTFIQVYYTFYMCSKRKDNVTSASRIKKDPGRRSKTQ